MLEFGRCVGWTLTFEERHGVVDSVNERWCRGALRLASVPNNPDRGMRQEMMSRTSEYELISYGRSTASDSSDAAI
ncbi:DUF4113 domain-containing protein [Pseudomonas vancouverensis]|uniref:DUF4113 domain-containing protein n=1 Tax=Pseudomonas vancouverensis TaxID=95300 RepID=UPI002F90EB63